MKKGQNKTLNNANKLPKQIKNNMTIFSLFSLFQWEKRQKDLNILVLFPIFHWKKRLKNSKMKLKEMNKLRMKEI